MFSSASKLEVAIIGAGIGGLAAAAALRFHGFDAVVYEKARELREVGAGVAIGVNGYRALSGVGLAEHIDPVLMPMLSSEVRTWQGEHVPVSAGWPVVRRVTGAPTSYTTHRAELQNALREALPAETVRLGHALTAVRQTEDRVELVFGDGSRAHADLVIGADGIHSTLRGLIGGSTAPVSEGIMAYRGLIPRERVARWTDVESLRMWVGPGRSFLAFPVSGGRLLNVVAFTTTDLVAEESWTAPGEVAHLAAEYAGWDQPVQEIIAAMDQTFRWGIYDHAPLERWSAGKIALLGDAAHATTPHLGQGANMAIEDAVALSVLLQGARPADVPQRFALYEQLRQGRTRAIQLGSRDNGRIYRSKELTAPQKAAAMDAVIEGNWIPDYDIAAESRKALATL